MNLFKDYTFTWRQLALFETSLLAIGIAVGANWPQIFVQYTIPLVVIGLGIVIYIAFVLFRKNGEVGV
jgi:hypothetical protein